MKIGIMTFHWATNYGAVLQAYCLQKYLEEQGHDVEIIDYKPKTYDTTWRNFLIHPSNWRMFRKFINKYKKERLLRSFRSYYLHCSKRYLSTASIKSAAPDYDILISGSDQIFNPTFTIRGEGKPTSAYYLQFGKDDALRLGYAVSFGCTSYPKDAGSYASEWLKGFRKIGVRETSGLDILDSLEYRGYKEVVPDPTILYGNKMFDKIAIPGIKVSDYVCVYMLRRELNINYERVVYIDETQRVYSLEEWLGYIKHSNGLITNSYHGMIMAILMHVPFVALLESGAKVGMNDRFTTLLNWLGLTSRISYDTNQLMSKLEENINWELVDSRVNDYRQVGMNYLKI